MHERCFLKLVHNLDIDAIGTHGRFSSDREDERKKTGMDAVFSAIEKSETYRRLLTQYEAKDAPTRYLQYLLSPRELWARAWLRNETGVKKL